MHPHKKHAKIQKIFDICKFFAFFFAKHLFLSFLLTTLMHLYRCFIGVEPGANPMQRVGNSNAHFTFQLSLFTFHFAIIIYNFVEKSQINLQISKKCCNFVGFFGARRVLSHSRHACVACITGQYIPHLSARQPQCCCCSLPCYSPVAASTRSC